MWALLILHVLAGHENEVQSACFNFDPFPGLKEWTVSNSHCLISAN
jgi:hypothetical protein